MTPDERARLRQHGRDLAKTAPPLTPAQVQAAARILADARTAPPPRVEQPRAS